MNLNVAYFEKHPELKFGCNNDQCTVVSAFKNPGSWLKSLCQRKETGVAQRRE